MGNTTNANAAQKAIQADINQLILTAQGLSANNQFKEAIQQLEAAQKAYTDGFAAAETLTATVNVAVVVVIVLFAVAEVVAVGADCRATAYFAAIETVATPESEGTLLLLMKAKTL